MLALRVLNGVTKMGEADIAGEQMGSQYSRGHITAPEKGSQNFVFGNRMGGHICNVCSECQIVGSQKHFMPKCGVTKKLFLGSQKGPAILTCAEFYKRGAEGM